MKVLLYEYNDIFERINRCCFKDIIDRFHSISCISIVISNNNVFDDIILCLLRIESILDKLIKKIRYIKILKETRNFLLLTEIVNVTLSGSICLAMCGIDYTFGLNDY